MKDEIQKAIDTAIRYGELKALSNHTCPVCEYNPSKTKSVFGLSGELEALAIKQLENDKSDNGEYDLEKMDNSERMAREANQRDTSGL